MLGNPYLLTAFLCKHMMDNIARFEESAQRGRHANLKITYYATAQMRTLARCNSRSSLVQLPSEEYQYDALSIGKLQVRRAFETFDTHTLKQFSRSWNLASNRIFLRLWENKVKIHKAWKLLAAQIKNEHWNISRHPSYVKTASLLQISPVHVVLTACDIST